jgi:glucose-1-phosphate cytidylyltransferase
MKVLILAGGFGTRLSEETDLKPKPMVQIGDMPILWHIMKIYSQQGFNEFVILLGYKGYVIKEYFSNYFLHNNNVTIDLKNNNMDIHQNKTEPWKITLLETGLNTMTGGRIKQAKDFINNETFLLTYGDGLCNLDINDSVDFHKKHGKIATLTSVQPAGRYGSLKIEEDNSISNFVEKPSDGGSWINGGFFVCEPSILDYIEDDTTVFEEGPLSKLANEGNLFTKKHHDFWCCMDTLRDKHYLNDLWLNDNAPWKTW